MEKKKLLLIAVSVGIFLIIVIGLSILIFLPKNKESQAVSRGDTSSTSNRTNTVVKPDIIPSEIEPVSEPELREPATVDAVGLLRNREDTGGLQTPPPSAPAATSRSSGNNGSSLVIEVPRPSSAAIPNASVQSSPSQTVNSGSARSNVTQTPPPASNNALVPAPPAPAAPAARPSAASVSEAAPVSSGTPAAVKPVQSTRSRDNYWVQAGSFSTQVRAEDVKESLAVKGITAIIENRDVNGQNYFRVRIGPYTSQNEADYWLALIKTINGFESSQIWQSRSEP